MNSTERTRLMHAVLDGETTSEETRELERVVASDPVARAEYDELRRLFDALSRVPKAYPPEGLVATVMARVPQPGGGQSRLRQLFTWPVVIGLRSKEAPGSKQGTSARVQRVSPQGPHFRRENMSEEKSGSFGKRKIWIGGGIAAAAVILAVSSGVDFPLGGKDTVGTIVPAQRYRAPQNTADDVKLGAPGTAQSTAIPAAGDAAGNAGGQNAGGQNAGGQNAGGQNAGGQNAGGQNAGGQNAGGQNAGGQNAGGQNAGGQNAGGQNAGGQNAGGQNAGGQNAGGQNAGAQNAGGQNAGGQNAGGQNAGGQNAAGRNASGQNAGGQNAGGQNAGGAGNAAMPK